MVSAEASKKLGDWIAELAQPLPSGWDRLIVYQELLREPDGYLRNCSRSALSVRDRDYGEDSIPETADAYFLMEDFFNHCVADGDMWSAIRLEILAGGKYHTQFWYDSPPLLNEDYAAATLRVRS